MQAAPTSEITLRSRIDTMRSEGRPMPYTEAVGIIVPLAAELADQHRQGYHFFLYPGALFVGEDQKFHASAQSASPPTDPRDLATLAPESQGTEPGGARASVYGVAAILYELLTLECVGRGMRRPSDIAPEVPAALEMILTKALVADPNHRPDDLNALAQAFYQTAPSGGMAPPEADVSHLDHEDGEDGFDVDVSMSLLPPMPTGPLQVIQGVSSDAPLPPGMGRAPAALISPTNEFEAMLATKARLESDPRPRYVVVRGGMDHGPFSAVELLQQIASNTFEEEDLIVDSIDKTDFSIQDSPDFAPFARHARMGRQEKKEKAALDQSVVAESRSTAGKAFLGIVVVGLLLGLGVFTYLQVRGEKDDEIAVIEETSANVESDKDLKVKAGSAHGSKGGIRGTVGGFPQLGGGLSCEAAQNAYVQEMKMGEKGVADLSVGQLGAVLNTGSYLGACGVPSNMGVNVCAAIQNGRAVGVTVRTTPHNGSIAGCISGRVRGLSFPSNPKLDVTRTSFAAQ